MKFGAHCFIFTERWSDDQLPLFDHLKTLGLDCLEIAVGDDVSFSPALTRKRASELGLDLIFSPGNLWPVECDLNSDSPEERALGLAWHQRYIDLAAETGAVAYAGALYGHPGTVKRRRPPAAEALWTADGLGSLAEYGARQGVPIVLEPMSHFRTHVANTPEQIMQLIALAGHPNLFVLLDTYHMLTEVRDLGQAVRTLAPRLWGLHACENDRGAPGGGLVPWAPIFGALHDVGFDRYIIFEAYNSSIDDFAFRRGMFHSVCPDGDEFVIKSLTFARQQLAMAQKEKESAR